ncbi:MAG: FlaD/FlaE family flagellar protein [Candidatus Thermoplasmatota archaeon]
MNEGDQNQGEKPLEEFEINTELTTLVAHKVLPQKIAQRIEEKIKEKNIRITKDQLYRLVDKIITAIATYTTAFPSPPEQRNKGESPSLDDPSIQTTDMRMLVDTIEQLNQRIKIIEEQRIDGVRGVSGKLVRTKDIKTFDDTTDLLAGNLQPLEHIPGDPESIVVIMKWLQYLVDRTGKNALAGALGYYVDVGWISEDVRLDLINYSKGITEDPAQEGNRPPHLPTKDHLQSLLFIQKLKGIQLDDRFLNKIERDMEKIIKSLEGHPLT